MLIGHQKLIETFKRLIEEDGLSHGYLFFGEPEVGKFSFALRLANYLETDEFEEPGRLLNETLTVRPDEKGVIGIDRIREIKYFLLQKPIYSLRRTALVDEAEKLTPYAQQAILKIAEEPPETGLIILVVSNPEVLLPTLQSRLQKIYFPRVSPDLIVKLLSEFKITKARATEIANLSFGRPGRAIRLANGKEQMARSNKKTLIEKMAENPNSLEENLTEIIAQLAEDPLKNHRELKAILNRLVLISEFNTNKRLQLESALWNI